MVTLDGVMDSYWKKIKAEDLAGTIFGVVKIINDIEVVSTERVVDRVIAKDIAAALDRHTGINPDSIDVEVKDGADYGLISQGPRESSRLSRSMKYTPIRDDQGRHLHPDAQAFHIADGVQHRLEPAFADLLVIVVAPGLKSLLAGPSSADAGFNR